MQSFIWKDYCVQR